jgi:3-methyladenine DNA glycosylase AlkD
MNTLIDKKLHALADSACKAFNEKIVPTGYEVLGVRMPALKKLAREVATYPDVESWLNGARFDTYEHVLLYGLVLGSMKKMPLATIFHYLDPLIGRFDNWAHVDTLISTSVFGIFRRHPDEVFAHFLPLKTHDGEFTKRVFVILAMDFYLDDEHIETTLQHLSEVPQGQYYVDMAIAWALSVGLVKFYDRTIPLLEKPTFSKFVHNKAIQKARESFRIPPQTKAYLNGLKIKNV